MTRVSVREAREQFRELLDRVSSGEEVVITRRGRDVARIVPPTPAARRTLPTLREFREKIVVQGEPLSETVRRGRGGERY
jgi:prevent-host-death family protein